MAEGHGEQSSYFKNCGNYCRVKQASLQDVQDFIRKRNSMEGTDKYRLPTEAGWQYAARSGGNAEEYAGTSSESEIGNYASYSAKSGGKIYLIRHGHGSWRPATAHKLIRIMFAMLTNETLFDAQMN